MKHNIIIFFKHAKNNETIIFHMTNNRFYIFIICSHENNEYQYDFM